MMIMMMISLHM